MLRHIPGEAFFFPGGKPSHDDDCEEDIPGIEALDTHHGLGHIGVLYDGHEEDKSTERLIPVFPGVNGQKSDDKCQ